MLKYQNATKTYLGAVALSDLSIQFEKGHIYALVGPNGSGKSTMMKAAVGLVKLSSGSVSCDEKPVGAETRAHAAYMSTEPFYYDFMRISDVGRYYADFYADFDCARYEQLIGYMQLQGQTKMKSLSSGMAAKLKIAATLARNSDYILLDEPLNGIDLIARDQIVSSIIAAASADKCLIISSHLIDELETFSDRVVFMSGGKSVLADDSEELRLRYGKSIAELYREVYGAGLSALERGKEEK